MNKLKPLTGLDGLIVLGRGNHPVDGASEATKRNGQTAAHLLKQGILKPSGLIIASGYGPDRTANYPITEARAMRQIIEEQTGYKVAEEAESDNTFANIENIRTIISNHNQQSAEAEVIRLGFIGDKLHIRRAVLLAKYAMSDIYSHHIIPTPNKMPLKEAAMERALHVLTKLALVGAEPNNLEDFIRAKVKYYSLISRLKSSNSANKIHSGR